jgi:WD40-like Beta Propeller Repeat
MYLLLLASCGRFDFDPLAARGGDAVGSSSVDAAVTCGAWEAPAPLIFANTMFEDWEPTIAPNGGPIVFTSNRSGSDQLYITPPAPTGPADVVAIASLNNTANQWGPAWNSTGTRLYFARDSGPVGVALFTSAYDGTNFAAPQLEGGFGVDDIVLGATLSRDELELFYNDNGMGPMSTIERATRNAIGDAWVKQGPVAHVNSGAGDGWPTLSPDGLTLMWESNRDAIGRIYTATRVSSMDEFQDVQLFDGVAPVAGAEDGDPDLTGGNEIYAFASARPGGNGVDDIWIAHRDCQ